VVLLRPKEKKGRRGFALKGAVKGKTDALAAGKRDREERGKRREAIQYPKREKGLLRRQKSTLQCRGCTEGKKKGRSYRRPKITERSEDAATSAEE